MDALTEIFKINDELENVEFVYNKRNQGFDVHSWTKGIATIGGTLLLLYVKSRADTFTKSFSLPIQSQILFIVSADDALIMLTRTAPEFIKSYIDIMWGAYNLINVFLLNT